MNINYTQ